MKHRRLLSTLLSLAILLSCVGWTPSRAEETTPEVQTEQSQAAEQTESAVYTEQMSREELPEIVAQEAPVNHGHVGRLENEEQDNLNQFIFLNQDGSKTMYLYDHPVKYRDEAGNIHDISLNIADTDDTAYPFRTEANWAVTAFPRELANGITLESESAQIKMIPILPENSTTVLNHMARRVDENTVAYTYDSATQLEYQLTYAGFKEEIVVSEYTGQTEYHFFLYTNGLALTQLDGGYYLTDEAGNIQGTIGDIIVFTADERNNTLGQLQAVTVKENGIYLLTIVLDGEYLADPNTQYPIRIDPTVSLTYAESGADAIEDVLLQSNSASIGERTVAILGVSQKGISRLLMRFPGIDFSTLAGVTVTSASVRLRDLMCEEFAMTVTCYPFTGSAWTESTADWSVTQQSWGDALSSHVFSYDNGEAQPTAFWYAFDITSLAQQWINGTADEDKGILFKADASIEEGDTYRYKTIGTYETDGYKPTFTMTYRSKISLNMAVADIDKGATEPLKLTATTVPSGRAVTWNSSNPSVATVDNGEVTPVEVGVTTITATCEDAEEPATCTVYVTVADGVYLIKNYESDFYLGVENAGINTLSKVQQQKTSATTQKVAYLSQRWKITYVGYGLYNMKPMHQLEMMLDVTNYQVDICADSNELYTKWRIKKCHYGYLFENMDTVGYAMRPEDGSLEAGAYVVMDAESMSDLSFQWMLIKQTEIFSGAILYDTTTQNAVVDPSRHLEVGEKKSLASLNLNAVAYSSAEVTPRYYWVSMDTNVAKVDENTGAVTGVSAGTAAIICYVYIDNETYILLFGICVGYPELFDDFIDEGCVTYHHFKNTDDGFFICTQPLANIIIHYGVTSFPSSDTTKPPIDVSRYYDDWYIMSVQSSNELSYGLYRMREQENDYDIDNDGTQDSDGDDPGVTVSFAVLDMDALRMFMAVQSLAQKIILRSALTDAISSPDAEFDAILAGYFSKTEAKGPYLIAEEYAKFIAKTSENGIMNAPNPCVNVFSDLEMLNEMLIYTTDIIERNTLLDLIAQKSRIVDTLSSINEQAGHTIYDTVNHTITIGNPSNLTYYEKQVILLTHCGNATFNSFAAEIEFHADGLFDGKASLVEWYKRALRSEMGLGEEPESGFYDEYYDLESDIVQAQAAIHGEY